MAKKENRSDRRAKGVRKPEMATLTMRFFEENPNKVVNYKQISHALGFKTDQQKQLLTDVLYDLADQGQLSVVDHGKFRMNQRKRYVEGVIDRRSVAKKTMLIPDDGGEPIFIAERSMGTALDGDRVKVLLFPKRKSQNQEGEVVEVLKRARTEFVGILEVKPTFAFLNMDKKQLTHDIFIPLDLLHGGKNGQRCVARIIEWEDKAKNPIGEIIDVLGDVGNNTAEMHAILAEFGLPYKYPEEIEAAADEIGAGISPEEVARRKDMRDVVTFTIDPRDAKDFDDALSNRKLENGLWEVGVHIADVTHYVTEEGNIEDEAKERATSVYLVDRTIPMLPEHFSNGICSLRPNEEKLTYSVVFQMDVFDEVKDYEIVRTVIKSDRRFTYEEAQAVIENGEGDYKDEILKLNELAKMLRVKRFAKGAIAFERTEVRFEIDETGKPISVYFKEAKEANKLIEEFMLLANQTVATFVGKPKQRGQKAKTFVYRVHDVPNPDKLGSFATFIKRFGYKLKATGRNEEVFDSLNYFLAELNGKKDRHFIDTVHPPPMA